MEPATSVSKEKEYEYAVFVNDEIQHPGWNGRWDALQSMNLITVREQNLKAHVRMEISPWYWIGTKSFCPGCEWATCPVGLTQDGEDVARNV